MLRLDQRRGQVRDADLRNVCSHHDQVKMVRPHPHWHRCAAEHACYTDCGYCSEPGKCKRLQMSMHRLPCKSCRPYLQLVLKLFLRLYGLRVWGCGCDAGYVRPSTSGYEEVDEQFRNASCSLGLRACWVSRHLAPTMSIFC